jgi:hypothetical protein
MSHISTNTMNIGIQMKHSKYKMHMQNTQQIFQNYIGYLYISKLYYDEKYGQVNIITNHTSYILCL